MKLLIITQTVDQTDPVLGFFHEWVRAFASEVESIEVVGLSVGVHDLPHNVRVHSLGKERGNVSSLRYAWRLNRLAWRLRREYDVVFAHMNPEYVLGGALLWKLLGKPMTLWYAHGATGGRLRLATWFSKLIFTSTAGGYRYDNPKRVIVGQGIDVERFCSSDMAAGAAAPAAMSLVTVGRLTRSKHLETLIEAVAVLKQQNHPVTLTIYGPAVTDEERTYAAELQKRVDALAIEQQVTFAGPVSNFALPEILTPSVIFVSDGSTGSLDKVLLEAMASECMVISSNEAFAGVTPAPTETTYTPHDSTALAKRIIGYTELPPERQEQIRQSLRAEVVNNHSLKSFVTKIIARCENLS